MTERRASNERYRHLTQEHFTAGDYEQFVSHVRAHRRPMKKPVVVSSEEEDALFAHPRWSWDKYAVGNDPFETFEYLFHKFKKGIYVQIVDNQLNVFLPFSNADYRNEYASSLLFNTSVKYESFEEVYQRICEIEGRTYVPNRVCRWNDQWYCNNGLVRYEFPLQENNSGVNMLHDMLSTLCQTRRIPDCEFLLNKRDFPVLSMHGYEPYDALVGPCVPLRSHAASSYLPILGMTTKEDFADIPVPTWEDWCRCAYQHDGRTFGRHHRTYPDIAPTPFHAKIGQVVFRGASTGLGTTLNDNPRLFFSKLALEGRRKDPTDPASRYLDVGITKWNARPRKCRHTDYLDIPDPDLLGIPLVDPLSPSEQSRYKYILHLPGHSFAYRLGMELSMGSVLLLYPCEYRLWYLDLLRPYEHYIPLERGMDRDEIFDKIDWCEANPETCERIARNARSFYDEHLSFDATLTYLAKTLRRLARTFAFDSVRYHDMDEGRFKLLRRRGVQGGVPNTLQIQRIIKKTRRTEVVMTEDGRMYKRKNQDMTHAHFVSTVLERALRNRTPNFAYSKGISTDGRVMELDAEDASSFRMTLESYLYDKAFDLRQFKCILLQILWSVQMAQSTVGFMHYDLTPWNVLLYDGRRTRTSYRMAGRRITVRHPAYVPKMTDYEYASVVVSHDEGDEVVHNIQPFFLSRCHDIRTLLYNAFHILLRKQRFARTELQWIERLMECVSGRSFGSIQGLKHFLATERPFSRLLLTNERPTPSVPWRWTEVESLLMMGMPSSCVRIDADGGLLEEDEATMETVVEGMLEEDVGHEDTLDSDRLERLYRCERSYECLDRSVELTNGCSHAMVERLSRYRKTMRSRSWVVAAEEEVRGHDGGGDAEETRRRMIRWSHFASVERLALPHLPQLKRTMTECRRLCYLLDRGYDVRTSSSSTPAIIRTSYMDVVLSMETNMLDILWRMLLDNSFKGRGLDIYNSESND